MPRKSPAALTERSSLRWLAILLISGCARQAAPETQSSPAMQAPEPSEAASPEAPPAPKSADKDDAEFASIEQAEAALSQAQAELERVAMNEGAPTPSAPGRASAASAGAARDLDSARADRAEKPSAVDEARQSPRKGRAPAQAPAAAAPAPPPAHEAEAKKEEDACEMTCKAFASLLRAKAAVCRLDKEGGARCGRAQSIVQAAEGRVASCACPR